MSHTETVAPPERFNFASHLIALNALSTRVALQPATAVL